MSAEEEEARRIAEMGKPILGEHSRLEVVIEESYEFKVHPFLYFLMLFPTEEQCPLCVLCCKEKCSAPPGLAVSANKCVGTTYEV